MFVDNLWKNQVTANHSTDQTYQVSLLVYDNIGATWRREEERKRKGISSSYQRRIWQETLTAWTIRKTNRWRLPIPMWNGLIIHKTRVPFPAEFLRWLETFCFLHLKMSIDVYTEDARGIIEDITHLWLLNPALSVYVHPLTLVLIYYICIGNNKELLRHSQFCTFIKTAPILKSDSVQPLPMLDSP